MRSWCTAVARHCRRTIQTKYYGVPFGTPNPERPGLHASCLPFLRDHDIAVLVWDMMDLMPNGYDIPGPCMAPFLPMALRCWTTRCCSRWRRCVLRRRYEFMLTIAPLKVIGGTGSPANPIALF